MKFQQIIFALIRIIQILISLKFALLNIIPKSLVTLQFLKFLIFQIKAFHSGLSNEVSIIFESLVSKQLQLIFSFYSYSICSDNHCTYRRWLNREMTRWPLEKALRDVIFQAQPTGGTKFLKNIQLLVQKVRLEGPHLLY